MDLGKRSLSLFFMVKNIKNASLAYYAKINMNKKAKQAYKWSKEKTKEEV